MLKMRRTSIYLQCKNCAYQFKLPSLILFALFVFVFLGVFVLASTQEGLGEGVVVIITFFIFIVLFTVLNLAGMSECLGEKYACSNCKKSDWVFVEKKIEAREALKNQEEKPKVEEENERPHKPKKPKRQGVANPIENYGMRERVGAMVLIVMFILFGLWASGRFPTFLNFFSF